MSYFVMCFCIFVQSFFSLIIVLLFLHLRLEGQSGAVDRASDFGPRGPWFDSPPVHISLWP